MAEKPLQEALEASFPQWEQWLAQGQWGQLADAVTLLNRKREADLSPSGLSGESLDRLKVFLAAMIQARNSMGQKLEGINQSMRSMGGYRPARDGAYYLDVSE